MQTNPLTNARLRRKAEAKRYGFEIVDAEGGETVLPPVAVEDRELRDVLANAAHAYCVFRDGRRLFVRKLILPASG